MIGKEAGVARCAVRGSQLKPACMNHSSHRQRRRCTQPVYSHTVHSHSDARAKQVFIFGVGYTSLALARAAVEAGWTVTGTVRRQAFASQLAAACGMEVCVFNPQGGQGAVLCDRGMELLSTATHVLSSIPPLGLPLYDPASGTAQVLHTQKKLLCRPGDSKQWIGYLSSTGVYGDWDGEWVDERSEPRPSSGTGLVRWEHEQAWTKLYTEHQLPVHVFRLSGTLGCELHTRPVRGIYGPGRNVLASMQKGRLSSKQERRTNQRFTSRCHVYDITQALLASMGRPQPGSIYNVADDDPAPRSEVVMEARRLVGLEASEDAALPDDDTSTSTRSSSNANRKLEEKRVRNTKMRSELGVELAFPTYREGLRSIHAGDTRPFMPGDLQLLGLA